MTRGPLHHEDTWAAWFEAAQDTLPISLATSLGCDKANLAQVSCIQGSGSWARVKGLSWLVMRALPGACRLAAA